MPTPMMVLIGDLCSTQLDFFFAKITFFFFFILSFLFLRGFPPQYSANKLCPLGSSRHPTDASSIISSFQFPLAALMRFLRFGERRAQCIFSASGLVINALKVSGDISGDSPARRPLDGRSCLSGRMLSPPRFDPVFCSTASVSSYRRLQSHSSAYLHADVGNIKVQILCHCA